MGDQTDACISVKGKVLREVAPYCPRPVAFRLDVLPFAALYAVLFITSLASWLGGQGYDAPGFVCQALCIPTNLFYPARLVVCPSLSVQCRATLQPPPPPWASGVQC